MRFAAASMRHALTLLPSQLELLDRAGRQFGQESLEALDCVQRSEYADQGDELGAAAGLDTLEGALADARALGELSLRQAGFDTVARDPLAESLGDRSVGQLS